MRIVFDIECDNLLKDVTKIHCLSYYNLDTDTLHTITDYKEIKELILSCKELIGHNIVQYDIPVIEKILGIEVPDTIRQIDTLVLSWYLYDNREKHGLEKWGEDLGVEKPKIEDWSNLDISDYIHRCENDVKINVLLYKKEEALLNILYQENLRVKESVINYLTFKMKCLKMQNKNPIYIDMDRLESGLNELTQLENSKIEELKQVMPKVPIYTIKNKPKILYKKDGSLSSNGQKWFDLLKELNLPEDYDSEIKILTEYNDGNPKSKQQLEEWLYLLGWKPLIYKDSETKNGVKKVAQIYNDKKEVCQSVKDLYSVEPKLENLENLGMIKHRLGVFKSFKEHQENGIIYSQAKGITSTYRIRHSSPFVNLAKPYLFYGKEIRALICIPNENYYLCGSDMKALEDTTKQHFMYYFDPKYVMEMRTPGFDPHLSIAEFGGLLSSEQVSRFKELKDKEQNDIEKEEFSKLNKQRNIAKVLNFSSIYGAGPKKISESIGIDFETSKKLHTAYWERNKSVKQFSESLPIKVIFTNGVVKKYKSKELMNMSFTEQKEFNNLIENMWVQNPISKFWLYLRGVKDIFSAINQNSGVFCFDLYYKEVSKYFDIIFQYHDELAFYFEKSKYTKEEVTSILKGCIKRVNDILKLNVPLDVDAQYGDNYSETH